MSKPTFLGPLIGKGVGQCELVYAERGSVLASHVEPAFDSKTRKKGLLGRESIPDDYALVIAPCSAVHTFAMRVPLDLVFVSRHGAITKTCRGVKPWRLAGSMKAFAVIEAAEGFIDRYELVPGEIVALRERAPGNPPVVMPPIVLEARAADAAPVATPTPAAAAGVSPDRHATGKRVTLADIIARKTPLSWFEAVAIVQELCAEVLARQDSREQRVPELKEIAISAEGRIKLLGDGPPAQWLVHRAGAVLLALVPEEQLPVQLRLLALGEVSPTPRLRSLRELSAELEFFERPNRRAIVSGVHHRYQELIAPAATSAPVPLPLLEPPPPRKSGRTWLERKSTWVVVTAGLLAAAALAAAWEWRRPEGQWLRDGAAQASAATVETAQWARKQAGQGVAAAKRAVGVDKDEPKAQGPGTRFVDASGATSSPRPPDQEPLPARPVDRPASAGVAEAPTPTVDLPRAPESGTWEAAGWIPGSVAAPPRDEVETKTSVFSPTNTQVVAPELIRPRLPKGPRPGVRAEQLPEVELVISPTGEVESVRLLTPGGGPRVAMMLSAVKTWQFQPAMLNGEPVRYRYRLKLIG